MEPTSKRGPKLFVCIVELSGDLVSPTGESE